MLSPGQFWKLVPTDVAENLRFRKSLNAECLRSARARELVRHACKTDAVFFVNAFCWQTNPNMLGAEDGPFICFDFQREALLDTIRWNVEERQLVLWEKSRMQGGTYLALFKDVWLTLFHRRKRSLLMSHTEKAVETSDDEDTLLGKVDFVIEHLPSWMQDGLPRKKGVVRMRRTKSQIVGTSTTNRTGVGGRATTVTGDEVSKWQNAETVLGTLKYTGPVLAIGTHYGVGGKFYEMTRDPLVRKIVLHWSMNPMYNRGLYRSAPHLKPHERVVDPENNPLPPDYPVVTDGSPHGGPFPGLRSVYYDKLAREVSSRELAMHWDIDPAGAGRQVFSPHLIRDLAGKCVKPDFEGDVVTDPSGRFSGLREAKGGPLRIWGKFLPHHQQTGRWMPASVYKVGGDIGAGTGATPSCLSGGDALTGKKVMEYAWGHPPQARPANFARIASALCHMLSDSEGNPAQLVWDRGGPTGETFGHAIMELGFRHFWYWRDLFALNPKISDVPGWFGNDGNARKKLFEDYEEGLRTGRYFNPSENALKETLAFEYDRTGKVEHGEAIRSEDPTAGRLNHSDMAYADGLSWMLMHEYSRDLDEIERGLQTEEAELVASGVGLPMSWIEEHCGGYADARDPFRR